MSEHTEAPVSPERLDELLEFCESQWHFVGFQWFRDIHAALLELKSLRDRCSRMRKVLTECRPYVRMRPTTDRNYSAEGRFDALTMELAELLDSSPSSAPDDH